MKTPIAKKSLVKKRLEIFIKFCGISISEFERRCNLGKGTIPNMRRSLDPDKLSAIAENFPALSIDWLMIGRGEMLRSNLDFHADQSSIDALYEKINILNQNIADLHGAVSAKDDTIAALKALIYELKNHR